MVDSWVTVNGWLRVPSGVDENPSLSPAVCPSQSPPVPMSPRPFFPPHSISIDQPYFPSCLGILVAK